MLFLFILLKALLFAAIAFGVGAAVALGMWGIGHLIKVRMPAFLRWGFAGALVLVYVFWINPSIILETEVRDEGWRNLAEATNRVCMGIAGVGLVATGVVISIIKGAIKLAKKGAQSVSPTSSEPPQPPTAS